MTSSSSEQEAYEAMIAALKDFANRVFDVQATIKQAIVDCKDNMDQDPHAIERTQDIEECYPALQDAAERALELAGKIQKEWDDIVNA